MTSTARSRQLDWIRELYGLALGALGAWGVRIATWLVTGNAAAMVLLFNAPLGSGATRRLALEVSLWLFATGLAFAFAGACLSYIIGTRVVHWVGESANTLAAIEISEEDAAKIEATNGPQPETNPLAQLIAEHEARLQTYVPRLEGWTAQAKRTLALYAVSALLFAAGILWPTISARLN